MFRKYVDLSSEGRLVAAGNGRLVYEHVDFPEALIKAYRPEIVDTDGQLKPRHRRRHRRLGAFHPVAAEMTETLAMKVASIRTGMRPPIPAFYGLVDTDLGPASVVERMCHTDGSLAPTLAQLVARGDFCEQHRRKLQEFFDQAIDMNLCLHDITPANVVHACRPGGESGFVAIDGLGERTFLKIRQCFPAANAYSLRKKQKQLMAHIEARLARRAGA